MHQYKDVTTSFLKQLTSRKSILEAPAREIRLSSTCEGDSGTIQSQEPYFAGNRVKFDPSLGVNERERWKPYVAMVGIRTRHILAPPTLLVVRERESNN